jgi:hypothetical protein
VFNTSRQIGSAPAVTVFGALLASADIMGGLRTSLLIAAALTAVAGAASTRLRSAHGTTASLDAMAA